MIIVHLDEAIKTLEGGICNRPNWSWPKHGLLFKQRDWDRPSPGKRVQLYLNDDVVWDKENGHWSPEEVWDELGLALLPYDIVCAPILSLTDSLHLPSLDAST